MRTLLSSLCQLRLEGWLSHLRLSHYISLSLSWIVSNVLLPFILSTFYCLQFLFIFSQYSLSNLLLSHLYNIFAIYLPGNSPLQSSLIFLFFICLTSPLYSSSSLSTKSCVFPKFSLGSYISSSAVYLFHHTRYLSLPLNFLLFNIFFTLYSSSPLITTGDGCFFL